MGYGPYIPLFVDVSLARTHSDLSLQHQHSCTIHDDTIPTNVQRHFNEGMKHDILWQYLIQYLSKIEE